MFDLAAKMCTMKPGSLIIVSSMCAALASGCGGGSGSLPAPAVSPAAATNLSSAPGEMAWASYLRASHKYTLKASSDGNSYTLQVSRVPSAGTINFNGSAPAYSSVDNVTLDENGVRLANNVSTDYFLLNPYVPLGRVSSGGSPYGVVTSSAPLPTALEVGSSGDMDSLTYYHDSTMSTLDAREDETYSVKANDPTTLLMCLDSSITNVTTQGTADDLVDDSESDCYTVDAAGNAALVSITLTVTGVPLTFE
jgi:hypothetical protein